MLCVYTGCIYQSYFIEKSKHHNVLIIIPLI